MYCTPCCPFPSPESICIQSLIKYAEKYVVSRASRKYNKCRSYIYFWRCRWDGSVESQVSQSRRPHSHPNQHIESYTTGRNSGAACQEKCEKFYKFF